MNRENTGAKPTAPPRLPPEAEQEILEALFEGMEIHSSEIAAILKKHGVCGDVEALQDSYRKRLGQRLMASLRDEGGKREVLANGKGSYVVLEGCGDRRQLKQIRRRIQNQMKGLDLSARKVAGPQVEKGWLRWMPRHSMSRSLQNWTQVASSCTSRPRG